MEFELRIAHIDVVRRRIRDRAIDPKDGKLNVLPWLGVPGNDHAIGSVESFDHGAAELTQDPWHLAVYPDLSIVVDHDLKSDCRTCGAEVSDLFGNSDVDAVPVESEFPRGTAFIQRRGIYDFPFGVVELDAACVRCEVVGFIWRSGRLTISSRGFEIDLDDLRVTIAPFASNKLRACFGGKVDGCLGFALGGRFVEQCARDKVGGQREEEGNG